LDSTSGINGMFRQCGFENQVTLSTGEYVFAHCHSEVAGTGKPVLNFNNQPAQVSIRFYAGGIDVRNLTHPGTNMTIDLTSGSVLLNTTVTTGAIVIRGVGDLTDLSNGATVTKKGFVSGEELQLARKILQNKQFTNATTGKLEVYNDAGDAVEYEANIYEDDGLTPWDGNGPIVRKDKLQ
jgi:hypothetical protein